LARGVRKWADIVTLCTNSAYFTVFSRYSKWPLFDVFVFEKEVRPSTSVDLRRMITWTQIIIKRERFEKIWQQASNEPTSLAYSLIRVCAYFLCMVVWFSLTMNVGKKDSELGNGPEINWQQNHAGKNGG
jgi:hypothetical protein